MQSNRFAATRNSALLLFDRLVRLVGNSIILLLMARQLGPESFGLLSYAQSLIVLATALATFGLPDILVREVIRHPRNADTIYAAAMTIRAVGSLVGIGLIFFVEMVARSSDGRTVALTVVLALALLFQSMEVFETKLQVNGRIALTALIRTTTFVLLAAAKIAVLIVSPSLILIAAIICIEPLLSGLAFFAMSRRKMDFGRLPRRARMLRTIQVLLSHSVWIFVRVALISFYMRIDHIFIERILGVTALGYYSAAVRLVELWFFLPAAVMAAVAPELARLYRANNDAYSQALKRVLAGLVGLSAVAALGLTVLAPILIKGAYGPDFAPSAVVLSVYAWSMVFGTIGQISNNWLVNSHALRVALFQAVIGALCALTLYPLLIAAFGLVGAALGFVVVQAITNVATNGLFRASRPLLRLQMATFSPTHILSLAKAVRPHATPGTDRPAC